VRQRGEWGSAEPPLLLTCIRRNNLACAAVDQDRCFSGNVLEARDQTMAKPPPSSAFRTAAIISPATIGPPLNRGATSLHLMQAC
jgi:flavin reductase (DIM6/NTAB) family NADH-FMN oxidoreductase RutF